ncbi:MAG: NAD(P)-dependent oxidoreductase [Andreesenia angusta]|nr:NAD(P)-dependent oxidoreductase [Andreesenia angusta]
MKNKIWISGADGRLGSKLAEELNPIEFKIISTDKDTVDIVDSNAVNLFADMNRPHIIINCSGLTDPLYCEENVEEAFRINGLGARNLAIASRRVNSKLVHLSTDDVFSGDTERPYREYDEARAQTIYGKSKSFGEQMVMQFAKYYFIVRSSWLYGKRNHKVEDIINEAKENGKVHVPIGQYASPTSTDELSQFIIKLIQTMEYGVYHARCQGSCSRAEFARTVLKLANIEAEVIKEDAHLLHELRPANAVMDDFLLRISGIHEFSDWEVALKNYMNKHNLI